MKNYSALFLMIIFAFNSGPLLAQNNGDQQSEESGIEARKVSENITVLMPKGGRVHKTNDLTYIQESTDEYAARNFASVENRLDKLEKDNRELRGEVNDMKSKSNNGQVPDRNVPDIDKE